MTPLTDYKMTDTPSTAAYTASAFTAFWGIFTVEAIVAILGLLLGIATFLVNIHYKRKEDRRAEERHQLHLRNFGGD